MIQNKEYYPNYPYKMHSKPWNPWAKSSFNTIKISIRWHRCPHVVGWLRHSRVTWPHFVIFNFFFQNYYYYYYLKCFVFKQVHYFNHVKMLRFLSKISHVSIAFIVSVPGACNGWSPIRHYVIINILFSLSPSLYHWLIKLFLRATWHHHMRLLYSSFQSSAHVTWQHVLRSKRNCP